MKYLCIDYGRKHIGLATSDISGTIAFPREVVNNDKNVLAYIVHIAHEENIDRIILGDTRTVRGTPNIITAEAEAFGEAIARATGKTVAHCPEMWTSFEAARYAPTQHHDDSVAAAIILQRYIDMNTTSGAKLPEEVE
jgi:putative transcription antitermination factor YqgF